MGAQRKTFFCVATDSKPKTIPSAIVGHNNTDEIAPGPLLKISPSENPKTETIVVINRNEATTRTSLPMSSNRTPRLLRMS